LERWDLCRPGKELAAVRSEILFVSFDILDRYGMSVSDHLK
jgi:hypothetical protein